MVTLDSYPVPAMHVQGRRLDNEAVVILPDKGEVKVLNEIAAQIWAMADGSRSVREIVAAICAEYAVQPSEAEADTLAFLAELENKGIIRIQGAG